MKKILLIVFMLFLSSLVYADDKMDLGLNIYKAQCSVCHTLKAAASNGDIGPNLDQLKPKKSQIILAVTNGIGVMPPWKDILTFEEIEAVAYYVFNSTNN